MLEKRAGERSSDGRLNRQPLKLNPGRPTLSACLLDGAINSSSARSNFYSKFDCSTVSINASHRVLIQCTYLEPDGAGGRPTNRPTKVMLVSKMEC